MNRFWVIKKIDSQTMQITCWWLKSVTVSKKALNTQVGRAHNSTHQHNLDSHEGNIHYPILYLWKIIFQETPRDTGLQTPERTRIKEHLRDCSYGTATGFKPLCNTQRPQQRPGSPRTLHRVYTGSSAWFVLDHTTATTEQGSHAICKIDVFVIKVFWYPNIFSLRTVVWSSIIMAIWISFSFCKVVIYHFIWNRG